MTDPTPSLITSRAEFLEALRQLFAQAAAEGSRELWLCDKDFADWPLGERGVIEHLTQWAGAHRRLTLVANNFDAVARRHPRWVDWRRLWAHVVHCRTNTELESEAFPSAMLATGLSCVVLSSAEHHRGRFSREARELVRCKELIDAVLQRSEESFPATMTGL